MKTNSPQHRLANQIRMNNLREHFDHANTGEILTKTWLEQISPRHPIMTPGNNYSTALGARLSEAEVSGHRQGRRCDALTLDEIIGAGGFFSQVLSEVAADDEDMRELITSFKARLRSSPKDSIAVFYASLMLEVAKSRAVSRMLAGYGVYPEDMIGDVGVDTRLSTLANPVIDAAELITVPSFPECSSVYRVLILKHLVSQCIEFAKAAQAILAATAKARA